MTEMTDELLARIAERAADPRRRYIYAAEDERRVSLPVEEIDEKFGEDSPEAGDLFREMQARMKAMGFNMSTMSYVESEGAKLASSDPPGAKPLPPPPGEADWARLEEIAGRPVPDDLRRLYSIANGGFGPGFTGLNELNLVGSFCEDFRRRGPDYCGTIAYPASFLPIAGELLDYHYDLDTGRIISSDQDWDNHGLDNEDIYDIAFPSLAAMMEDWLQQS